MNLTQNESLFYQAIATISLMEQLNGEAFFKSQYYRELKFPENDEMIKYILINSGIGNPVTLQMFFYVLLVVPRELFQRTGSEYDEQTRQEFNEMFFNLASDVQCTYASESEDLSKVDYYKHVRNAISHSKCSYKIDNGICYVTFEDKNVRDTNQHCELTITTGDAGKLLGMLKRRMMEFLNSNSQEK